MSIRTLGQLSESLDDDLQWRKNELTTAKVMLEKSRSHEKEFMLRAGICLLYAHWEGFVKMAATSYVSFVALRGLRYRDLSANFVALGLRQQIRNAGQSTRPTIHIELTEKLMSDLSERYHRIDWENSVDTRSNLNGEALREILALLGLPDKEYESKEQLLNKKLLANRNLVAHGERVEIDLDDYNILHTEIIGLIDRFNTDVQNAAATEQYRRLPIQ